MKTNIPSDNQQPDEQQPNLAAPNTAFERADQTPDSRETRVFCRRKSGKTGCRRFGQILVVLLIIVAVLLAGLYVTVDQNLNRFTETTLPEKFNIPADTLANPLPQVDGITNILLLGVDNRNAEAGSIQERSDSMMILTIDSRHGRLKLTSLQRDMVVYFPGDKTPNKINSANAVGGPLLAMRVVEDALRLKIDKFVVVNMAGLEQIIDAVGGVKVDVSKKELKAVNEELAMVNKTFPDTAPSPTLEAEGVQILNGRQAVTYARIRKIDSDYARMERQREVIQALAKSARKAGPTGQYRLLTTGLSDVTTNLSTPELALLGLRALPLLSQPIAQLQVPIEGYFNNVNTDAWKSLCDFNGMIPLIQDFIFEATFPFDPVKKIKGAPNK